MTDPVKSTMAARDELYEIIRDDVSFDEKAHLALELGKEYLGADNAHLTRIDRETDHWEALISTDPADGRFPAGLELDLGTTYCRRTIGANGPIALYDVPDQGWEDDPAFETHGLHCYHGTTLVVNDEPFGTVCFVAEDRRQERFSDNETMFAELVTRLLERELEREQHEAELLRQANLATVLNRVLRHNLRNEMSVIRGYTQFMAKNLDDGDRYSEVALRHIDKIIALSEKARELDQIVGEAYTRRTTDIGALIERVSESVSSEYPSASISVESTDELTTAVLPSFERAMWELIENAAKHGGENPSVTITVEAAPNAIDIHVSDDGPGLSELEQKVLRTGTETPMVHGSGLGLWLAHWIVTSHDGSVEATVEDSGTRMAVSVPRLPETDTGQQLTELKRARDQYQAAFEGAHDAMLLLNDGAQIVDANPAATRIYGRPRQELLGQSISTFLPDDFDFESAWAEFLTEGRRRDTVTVVDADDELRYVEYTATTDVVPGLHLIIPREVNDFSS